MAQGEKRSTRSTNAHTTQSTVATAFKTEVTADDPTLNEEELYEEDDEVDDYDDDGCLTFIPKQSLSDSQTTSRTLESIMKLISDPRYLDLNPDYQRGVVWANERMSALIDSFVENYYVPPVIFNVENCKDGKGHPRYKRTCVDGKQRLSSIHDFMIGKIPCHDRKRNKWYYTDQLDEEGHPIRSSKTKLILPERMKQEFRKKSIVCYEFMNLSHEQEEDLFQRVQKGVQLTPAEKFRATRGTWQSFAIMYEQDFPTVVNLSGNIRSSGFRNLLTCFAQILEAEYPSTASGVPQLRSGVAALDKFLQNEHALNDKTRDHFGRVFRIFNDLVEDDPQTFQNNSYRTARKFAPIELVAVAVLISKHGVGRSMPMLHGDIKYLREFLRERNADLRMNGKVWGDVWEFIDDLESHRGTTDGSTVPKKPKPKGRQTRVSQRIAASENASYLEIPEPAAAIEAEEVPMPAASGRALNGGDDEEDDDFIDTNVQSEAMLNRFMQGAKQAAEPAKQVPERPKEAVQPANQAAEPPKENQARPAGAPVATMGPETPDEVNSLPKKSQPDATSFIPLISYSVAPATNIKRRAHLDLGVSSSGARALAAKKARLA
ncbi:MAG: hypothetical protein M1812_002463 [Candelaria pacifica]|nr:MAG: hypothetical protein M1812_002463 [Candelaria pacifica]